MQLIIIQKIYENVLILETASETVEIYVEIDSKKIDNVIQFVIIK